MIFKAGTDTFTLPEPIEPYGARLMIWPNGDPEHNLHSSYAIDATPVTVDRLMALRADKPKLSKYSHAFAATHDTILIYPSAAEDLYAQFRYCPAMKVI